MKFPENQFLKAAIHGLPNVILVKNEILSYSIICKNIVVG